MIPSARIRLRGGIDRPAVTVVVCPRASADPRPRDSTLVKCRKCGLYCLVDRATMAASRARVGPTHFRCPLCFDVRTEPSGALREPPR